MATVNRARLGTFPWQRLPRGARQFLWNTRHAARMALDRIASWVERRTEAIRNSHLPHLLLRPDNAAAMVPLGAMFWRGGPAAKNIKTLFCVSLACSLMVASLLLLRLLVQSEISLTTTNLSALTAKRPPGFAEKSGQIGDAQESPSAAARSVNAFQERLISVNDVPLRMGVLLRQSSELGLDITQGEYRQELDAVGKFVRHKFDWQLLGPTAAVMTYIAAALRQHSGLYVENLRVSLHESISQGLPGTPAPVKLDVRLTWVLLSHEVPANVGATSAKRLDAHASVLRHRDVADVAVEEIDWRWLAAPRQSSTGQASRAAQVTLKAQAPKPSPVPAISSPPMVSPAPIEAPPPWPFRVLGQYRDAGGHAAFLLYGDEPIIARAGQTLAPGYFVEHIDAHLLRVRHLRTHHIQIVTLDAR